MNRPNILLIVLDTLRRDRLSAYGYPRETSPELDRFAADSTVFQRAVAPAQWTIPAHGSLFTGLYPTTHQLTQAYGQLAPAHTTLAETLHAAGYRTAAFCNNPLVGVLDTGLQRGFEDFYNYAGAAVNRPFRHRGPLYRAIEQRWRRFAQPTQNRFANSDWLFRVSMNPLLVSLWTRLVNYKGHTANSVDDLIQYLSVYGQADRPLFTFLNLMGAHLPYRPPQDYLDRIAPRQDRHAYRFVQRFNNEAGRWAAPTDPPLADWEQQALTDFYDAEILHQDAHLGRLLDSLKRSGALDNTLVIITADHGESHGDHDYFGHSFVVYQELVHVPLIVRWPDNFAAGRQVGTNVSTRRIYHTILDVAGVNGATQADRLTLAHATNGRPDVEGGIAYAEAFPPSTFLSVIEQRQPALIDHLNLRQVRRGIYDGDFKLALVHDRVEGLYNVAADPAELRDVAGQHPDTVQALQTRLNGLVDDAARQRADHPVLGQLDPAIADNLRALGYLD